MFNKKKKPRRTKEINTKGYSIKTDKVNVKQLIDVCFSKKEKEQPRKEQERKFSLLSDR